MALSVVRRHEDASALEVVRHHRDEPAPLLAILHELQDREGFLRREALETVADALPMPAADLYSVVTFYAYFKLAPVAAGQALQVCDGPACRMQPGHAAVAAGAGGRAVSCVGRCERPLAVFDGRQFLDGVAAPGTVGAIGSALPTRVLAQEVFFAHVREPDQATLAGAESRGAYQALERARAMSPQDVIATIGDSRLEGRGGAGFPAGAKWSAVRAAAGATKWVVVNADEGEPGTFKDRVILEHDPHRLLEGAAIAAHAVGAGDVVVYLRYEYPEALTRLQSAVREAAERLAPVRVHVRRGAGAYICGEETSLLNSLEGQRPWPREKPPYPTTAGLFGQPTLVSNVETLAAVPWIVEHGAAAWHALGVRGCAGTKLYSVSGDVARPGNYELALGTTVRELLEHAGGAAAGHTIAAFTLGGISGGLFGPSLLDTPLDFASFRPHGGMLGSGGVVFLDERRCLVDFVRSCMAFYAHESCGKCFPCRIGTRRIVERMADLTAAGALSEIAEISTIMSRTSACGLGIAAPSVLEGLRRYFPETVTAHAQGHCAHGVCGATRSDA